MLSFVDIFKNINKNTLIKLILNILVIFIFTIIYYNNRESFDTNNNHNIENLREAIYLCLSIHTGLGIGEILPNLQKKKETGLNIIIVHLTCIVLIFSLF